MSLVLQILILMLCDIIKIYTIIISIKINVLNNKHISLNSINK